MIEQTKTSDDKTLSWVDIEAPSREKLLELRQNYSFNAGDINDCDVATQRPKLAERDHYLFLILHIPIFNRETRRTSTAELDIFVTDTHIFTLHPKKIPMMEVMHKDLNIEKIRNSEYNSSGHLLYVILKDLFNELYNKLDHISEKIDAVEDAIFKKDNVVEEIFIIKQDIFNFRKVIKPQRTVLDPLTRHAGGYFGGNLTHLFKSVISSVIGLWNILEGQREMIDILEKTNESIMSQKLNQIIAFLTIGSFVSLPVSIIAGITADGVIFDNSWLIATIASFFSLLFIVLYFVKRNKIL